MQLETRHLFSIQQLDRSQLLHILDTANQWIDANGSLLTPAPLLKNKTIINLFFENSTRTCCSFELAAKRLGADVLNFDVARSSLNKGEVLLDTIDNLQAMGVDLFVMRHPDKGACQLVATHLQDRAGLINAGDGTGEHPTQALLDMFTMKRHKKDWEQLSVAIVGDVLHSRVAHSDILALKILGVPDIRLVGPPALLPEDLHAEGVQLYHDILPGISGVDVVIVLRLQRERMIEALIPNPHEYFQMYGVSEERLQHAKPDAIVMHPGPVNREIEMASSVMEGRQSVILEQVRFGVAVRMAVMSLLKK